MYSVKGGAEKVVPLPIPRASVNVTGRHTLFLEELDVHPGDFVSYYVRARDLTLLRLAAELRDELDALSDARRAERMPLREESARWVHDEFAADRVAPPSFDPSVPSEPGD